ncbi:hypothetical protein BJV74DRAFT_99291 [Russula compacta]|nr:hypothetical protein BJV74DRAFT_99291 [Russula compacta]
MVQAGTNTFIQPGKSHVYPPVRVLLVLPNAVREKEKKKKKDSEGRIRMWGDWWRTLRQSRIGENQKAHQRTGTPAPSSVCSVQGPLSRLGNSPQSNCSTATCTCVRVRSTVNAFTRSSDTARLLARLAPTGSPSVRATTTAKKPHDHPSIPSISYIIISLFSLLDEWSCSWGQSEAPRVRAGAGASLPALA